MSREMPREMPRDAGAEAPQLYYAWFSPPCRAVALTGAALGLRFRYKTLSVVTGEHLKPKYLELNPQHTVPTLVDGGFALAESRAIMTYLAERYGARGGRGGCGGLYPAEPRARARVDQLLYFDHGTLYKRYADYAYPQHYEGAPADPDKRRALEEALDILETMLARGEDGQFLAGPALTLADLAVAVTVSTFHIAGVHLNDYPRVNSWFARVREAAPGYKEANGDQVLKFEKLVKSFKIKLYIFLRKNKIIRG